MRRETGVEVRDRRAALACLDPIHNVRSVSKNIEEDLRKLLGITIPLLAHSHGTGLFISEHPVYSTRSLVPALKYWTLSLAEHSSLTKLLQSPVSCTLFSSVS